MRQIVTTAVVGSTPVTVSTTTSPGEIRAWGVENGYAVGVRGRLSSELVQAYELAMLDLQNELAGS
jgi:DNA polymerase-3 subunit epsilon